MIKDKIENISKYSFGEYFDILKEYVLGNTTNEEYLLKIEKPFKAILLEYQSKNFDLSKFETHIKNIDVHYILEGIEYIGVSQIGEVKSNMEYNEDGDYQLFDGDVKDKLLINKGEFLVLFPNEAHVTGGFINNNPTFVKKIVFKVPV